MKKKWFLGLLALCMSVAAVAFVGCDESGEGGAGNDDTNIEQEDGGETPESYTVTYDANGGTFSNGATSITDTIEENGKLIAPESPSRKNYSFSGWGSKNGGNMWDFATDTVTESITLYATWEQQSAVILSVDGASMEEKEIFMFVDKEVDSVSLADKVICSNDSTWKLYYDKLGQTEIPTKMAAGMNGYLQQGANEFYIVVTSNDGVQVNVYELNVFRSFPVSIRYMDGEKLLEEFSAEAGYEYVADYLPEITGYKFNYWETLEGEPYQTQKLWTGLSLIANTTANTYTVTYDVNKGDELPQTDKQVTYDSDYTLAKPTRTGYSFVGWYYNGVKLTDENGQSIAAWDIPNNATFTAEWKVNQYTVALNKDVSNGGKVSGANDYDYNSEVIITASTNNGYVFTGWYDGEELLTEELSYTFQMPAENVSYTAKWRAVPVTLARNNMSAGSVSTFGKYVLGDEITVTAYSYIGYVFTGWYNGNVLLTEELSYTFAIPTENLTYTATWEVAEELKEFDFTSTKTTCTITGLKDETIAELVIPDLVTGIGKEAFFDNNELTSVVISDSVKTIEKYAFGSCDNLLSVVIGNGVETVGEFAFSNCVNLTDLVIGENVKTIEKQAFNNCSKLTLVILKDKVTTLGYGAFYGCSGLKEIVIGDSVKTIGEAAFWNCDNIKSVYYKGTKDEWENITIGEYNEDLTDYLVNRYYYIENEEDVNSSIYYLCWHYVDGVPTAWETN